jgi:hypothetical protein
MPIRSVSKEKNEARSAPILRQEVAQMAWRRLTKVADLAAYLDVPLQVLNAARRQRDYVYVEKRAEIKGKTRQLCYPEPTSDLRHVQNLIKEKCLAQLPLNDAIYGYRPGHHHITCAQIVAGQPFAAHLDIKDFHPSIGPTLIRDVLLSVGTTQPVARIVTQLVTYRGQVPQGAPTSNHIANLVVQFVLEQGVLAFCEQRRVIVVNYGDDTAFAGEIKRDVSDCIAQAKAQFAANGLRTNDKTSEAEHIGARRDFIGTATGRATPDLPRRKQRAYRKALRNAIELERRAGPQIATSKADLASLRAKIAYVERLNPNKARALKNLWYRLSQICWEKRAPNLRPRLADRTLHSEVKTVVGQRAMPTSAVP